MRSRNELALEILADRQAAVGASTSFPCLMVRRRDDGGTTCAVEQISVAALPPGDVLIHVACSSLNFKDALASQGHPGVIGALPHVPGIDCAGQVAESASAAFQPGDAVLVTGYDFGAQAWGGFSEYVRVPAEWVVPMPAGFTPEEAMTLGTAGFTAAQCVHAIERHGISPDRGEVAVTGASGAVGTVAIALLAKLGYRVAAATGKVEQHPLLRQLGADRFLTREEVSDRSDRPLLKSQWAAAVDTVGGATLSTLMRSTIHRGCVAACGLVGGDRLEMSVYPLLLRGATLYGIDSAKCPREPRMEIWDLLSGKWRMTNLEPLRSEVTLSELPAAIERMLAGKSVGRVLVRPRA
jgi:acrylyl-CoA reductase (NADPH)